MRRVALVLALAVAALSMPRAATAQQQDANLVAKGAALYGKECARCHNLRSPTEFTDVSWRTIMAQMRARANLTRDEARAILAFVQATNGIGGNGTSGTTAPSTRPAPRSSAKVPADRVTAVPGDADLSPAAQRALKAYVATLRSKHPGS